jgi:hypothetical protein
VEETLPLGCCDGAGTWDWINERVDDCIAGLMEDCWETDVTEEVLATDGNVDGACDGVDDRRTDEEDEDCRGCADGLTTEGCAD